MSVSPGRVRLVTRYADAMIAGIALDRRAGVATRNVKDFDGVGLELVDPWD